LLAAKAGATYVSPFIGRLDDIGENGIQLIEDIKKIFNNYKNIKTKILSASIRSVEHFNAVAAIGSDVATVPVKIFKELHKHHLTDKGVDIFTADWKKSGMKILT
jgi:transaldolase